MSDIVALQTLTPGTIRTAYVLAFGLAALASWASVSRARRVVDPDTRRGLTWLLLTSGGWAAAHVAFLLVPGTQLKVALYQAGLVVGIAAVGPWLYFCSAYTGRSLHRSTLIRRVAVGVFLALITVKLTNPWHGLYFQATPARTPFPHLAIEHQLLHWLAMGLAYALATVGYFMLFERFWQVGRSTVPLAGLAGLTALPLVLDVLGLRTDLFIELTYEPLGVAAFAVGVLYLYVDVFEAVRLTGSRNRPVVVLDAEDRVREYNEQAASLLPEIRQGAELSTVLPAGVGRVDEETVVEIEREAGARYYQLTPHAFAAGGRQLGRILTFADVTEREQYRTELERQNERLERFAAVVSHDLRNPLTVAKGRLELLGDTVESEDLKSARDALERMEALIEDVLTLAREGQPIGETERVSLAELAEACWTVIAAEDATLDVEGDIAFEADPDRLRQLLENLFRNAVDHGPEDVTITVETLADGAGFAVEDDGPGIPAEEREQVFEFGHTTAESGTGFGLAIVREIANAHGWTVSVTDGAAGGARFEVTGVEPASDGSAA